MTKKSDGLEAARTLIKLRNQAPPLLFTEQTEPYFPLSLSQERLLALEQLNTTTPLYNLRYAFHLRGDLNMNALSRSLETVLTRQHVLRTVFGIAEGQPKQIIQPYHPVEPVYFDVMDFSAMPFEQAKVRIIAALDQPFNLQEEPAFRYRLYRLGIDEHVVSFTFHHIVSDYWSENLFFKDFSSCYKAFLEKNETNLNLKPLPVRYADFALWQRQWLSQAGVLEFLLGYWHPRLQGLTQPDLPADHSLAGASERRIEFKKITIAAEQVTALKQLARQSKVKTFTILLTALKLTLAEYLHTDDVAVFSPVTNRHRPELQHLMGDFSNLLILRSDLSGNPTIAELLQRVGQVVSGAIAHQDLPLQLIRACIPLKMPQVSFSYLNIPQETLTLSKVDVEPWDFGLGTNDFELFLLLTERKGCLEGYLKYNTSLFSETTVQTMLERFQVMLTAMSAQPEQPVSLLLFNEVSKQSSKSTRCTSEKGLLLPIAALVEQVQQHLKKSKKENVLRHQLSQASAEEQHEILKKHIRAEVERIAGKVPGDEQGFFDLGLDSLTSIQLGNRLALTLDIFLPATITLEQPSVAALTDYLAEVLFRKQQNSVTEPPKNLAGKKFNATSDPIAIVGMACRFPGGAHTPEQFWQLLQQGQEAVTDIPASRWSVDEYYDPEHGTPGKMYTRQAHFLQHPIEEFDPLFFGMSPVEGQHIEPRHRLLLEVTWEALENAGLPVDALPARTGIFAGLMESEKGLDTGSHDVYAATGTLTSMATGRLAYVLGVHGPNITIDTACSSSLTALHLACQSLRAGECQVALCGGVNVMLYPKLMIGLAGMQALSPDGRSKTFSATADGFGRGEGCGMVVLKRLSDALEDGDRIEAVVRTSAINHDGPSSGLTVPSKKAQTALIRQALAQADITGKQISYIEAHGTGTKLGDPIEVRALADALGERDDRLYLGSVKTNIGHLDASAGIAGLIKVVLALQHQEIPPHLHFNEPSPLIDWKNLPFKVPTQPTPWPAGEKPRIAGVSAFGLSGTNAHVIVQEAPQAKPKDSENPLAPERPVQIVTLSGKTEEALADQVDQYHEYLTDHTDSNLADVCYTANTGRMHFEHRLAAVAKDVSELSAKLAAHQKGETVSELTVGKAESEKPKIAFLFTGQGSQYADMGRILYETQPLFRETMEQCDRILQSYLEISLLKVLYGKDKEKSKKLLSQTKYTQPALFAIEYALAGLWQSWGIEPIAVIGHSVGEYAAACIAGVFSLEDGLKLIAERGGLMQALPPNGMMTAVQTDETKLLQVIAPYLDHVSIAGLNAPQSMVLSGERQTVTQIIKQLQAEGIKCKPLNVSRAFHSPLMESMLAEFGAVAQTVDYAAPQLKLISNLTGEPLAGIKAEYWIEHARQAVRFAQGMTTLKELEIDIFLEIGPKPILLGLGQQCLSDQAERLWLPSLYPDRRSDWAQMADSLAKLHVRGGHVDWRAFDQPYPRRKVSLPTYPFQRKRHWVDRVDKPGTVSRQGQAWHPLLGERLQPLATSREIAFQNRISAACPAYLNDHQIYNQVIAPATAYLEMALSAGTQISAGEQYVLQNVVLLHPLALSEETESRVQLLLTPVDGDDYQWQIFSFKVDTDEWQQHVSGELRASLPDAHTGDDYSLSILQQRCTEELSLSAYEISLPDALCYGPDFQGISQLFRGEKEALGLIRMPENLSVDEYRIHPVLLDCCLRTTMAVQTDDAEGADAYLPFSFDQIRLLTSAPLTSVWCYAKWRGDVSGVRQMDLILFDEAGQVAAEVSGFSLRQADRQAITGSTLRTDWLYEMVWPDAPLPQKSPYANEAGHWLIVSEPANPQAQRLAELLRSKGEQVDLSKSAADTSGVSDFTDYRGVIYLAAQPATLANHSQNELPEKAFEISCQLLELMQNLIKAEAEPDLWLVMQDRLEESVLWGLGRTLMWEQPQLNCRCFEAKAGTAAETLFKMIWHADGENQIRIDGRSQRQAARLEQLQLSALDADSRLYPFQIQLEQYGLLDSLQLVQAQRREPQANQVEVQVQAVGLNFRDVLNALGMLKSYYPPELGFDDPKKLPFGFEAAGTITQVGDDAAGFQVGDEVIVWQHFGSLASFITLDSHLVGRKPKHLSFAEAATIPITFLTAYYALIVLADMQAGDKVLIHAAAGGVGQAAIQLAQHVGAEIFATASLPKHDFLKAQGIDHIMDSRTLEYADRCKELTDGQGVDIVLNSMNGEYIQKNFDVLGANGRFIELGKIDIWDKAQAENYRPDVKYAPFDWSDMASAMEFRTELEKLLAEKKITPLPCRIFSIEKAEEAFQFMAKAKHIGKVVLSMPLQQQATEQKRIKSDRSYLITGGFGGLGLKTAEWLTTQGATHLVLSGRRTNSEAAQSAIADLENKGVKVKAVKADISQAEEVKSLLHACQEFAPLKGIVHSAGVLDDGVITQQTPARFAKTFAPKVQGSWHLHQYSQGILLDFFVCFSSQSSLLGNGGQANYAAANAFMDALMHQRQTMGLPALSINWGGWSEVGMAKELMEKEDEAISPQQGVELFEALLVQDMPQAGAVPLQWRKFSQKLPSLAGFPVLSKLIQPSKSTTAGRSSPQQQFSQASSHASVEEQYEILQNHIKSEIEPIVGTIPADEENFFVDLGMDSLMSIQLSTRLTAYIGVSVSVTTILEHPTVPRLSQALSEMLSLETKQNQQVSSDDDGYEEGEL
ncbi:SDR family NAD(P)-dependent oxidoreductase [Desulfobulbus sp. TB]|nr:SDR family NAD(P)-dependent oxidoreductase [Desulfobulbus sp. TB]